MRYEIVVILIVPSAGSGFEDIYQGSISARFYTIDEGGANIPIVAD